MEKEKYLNDLSEIRKIMSRSARFISLSGLSGVSTGLIALAGALLAHQLVFRHHDYLVYEAMPVDLKNLSSLLLIALGTLLLSVVSALWFTGRKSRKEGQRVWDNQAKRLLINLLIPLTTGGILCLILLFKGYVGLVLPLTLIFYGLALVNGSHYTFSHIRYLGIAEILLGLVAFLFIDRSLYLWMLGFGVVQMIYGMLIQRKG
ncbi:MAG: hypothetical protein A2W86_01620 [Bacteroidetes bacterium GWD2_45_23]|nr:MAG: hypothetical protein A2W87_02400 [Bacteroidetes bacterium GWC2_46_850]OFX73676.1 MAG: hypothetical protein A2071_11310 [Bacteroidetes bacterium GWC1_47_7]OFX86661.1 MAG: hypothetical protein A2W86_01620 [Bacteroidetes bacterium GWD2_45_23]HAR38461.1 hypothetical protein [Porphyromonadaceae bacterium]HBB01923.1 hypothetical protein [Porphyromonadaceae bacterium]